MLQYVIVCHGMSNSFYITCFKKSLTMCVCSHNAFWNKSARLILLRSIGINPQGEMNSCIVTNASSKTQTQWNSPAILKTSLTMCVCSHKTFWNKSARLILLRSIRISPQGEMNSVVSQTQAARRRHNGVAINPRRITCRRVPQ